MRILLVVDGSSYSEMATGILKALRFRSGTEVTVLTVVPEYTFLGRVSLSKVGRDASVRKEAQQQKALELLQEITQALSASRLKAESLVRWGNPAETILKVADEKRASLIAMGAKGQTDQPRFRLGSTAQKVMKYAKASVLLARNKPTAIKRVLLATDGSEHSDMVARFLLNVPLPRRTQVIVVTALQSHLEALIKMPTLDLQTNQRLLAQLQEAEESRAWQIVRKCREEFQANGHDTLPIVMRGEAAESILKAAETHNPDIIALGSKGLTTIESFIMGSVAERVARYADCSVLIGRTPG
ncbi:MAG: universal stress protein [Dehalococcoidales bacterium]|nr:universal stress protein [Dehalococcoidales bacterium]